MLVGAGMRWLAVVLALSSACTFHHAVEIGGAALATTGLVLAATTSSGGDDCSSGLGQCVFTGSVDSAATRLGEAMVAVGLVTAFIALLTDHPPAPAPINQLPR